MRSVRSRSSRTSTKPAIETLMAGRASTGCATCTALSVATAKPAATAAPASASGKATGRRRARIASTAQTSTSETAAHHAGSRSAAEVDRNAEPEGDRKPRQQTARPGVGDGPVADVPGEGLAEIGQRAAPGHHTSAPRRGVPRRGTATAAASVPVPIRHALRSHARLTRGAALWPADRLKVRPRKPTVWSVVWSSAVSSVADVRQARFAERMQRRARRPFRHVHPQLKSERLASGPLRNRSMPESSFPVEALLHLCAWPVARQPDLSRIVRMEARGRFRYGGSTERAMKRHWILCAALLPTWPASVDAKSKSNCALMQRLAQQHSNDMARRESMDHSGFYSRAARGAQAENVAMGSTTRAGAVAQWRGSPGHAANMRLPGCKAVASAVSRSGRRYWTMLIGR